jgi:hypothetical protein
MVYVEGDRIPVKNSHTPPAAEMSEMAGEAVGDWLAAAEGIFARK